MKKGFLKSKALFQITILIIAIFSFSYLIKPVHAQEKVCCPKTKGGEYCQYTDAGNCAAGYTVIQSSCDQSSYCQLGCCFNEEQGSCFKNSPKAACDSNGGVWSSDPTCSMSECSKGCCMVGIECAYVTEKKCKQLFSQYPSLEYSFQEAGSEFECVDMCTSQEEGCCVSGMTCTYMKGTGCVVEGFEGEFYSGQLCSSIEDCYCKAHDHKECYEEDVYWYDSCGNRENIAEDCDYASGTLCGSDEKGEIICKSVDCETTYKDEYNSEAGGFRKNGESWCIYDGKTGGGADLVGSRQYRHICINGEEIEEPCEDYREEVCIQGDITNSPRGDYKEAACIENRWEDCMTECNQAEIPELTKDEDKAKENQQKYEEQLQKDKECCEREDLRDCVWIKGDEEPSGRCIPKFSPGFKFWSGGSSTETPTSEGSSYCEAANIECSTIWKHYDVLWLKETKPRCQEDGNCGCYNDDFLKGTNNYCRAAGDCGAHYNYLGEFTNDGYSRNWEGKDPDSDDFDCGEDEGCKSAKNNAPAKKKITEEMIGSFESEFLDAGEGLNVGEMPYKDIFNYHPKLGKVAWIGAFSLGGVYALFKLGLIHLGVVSSTMGVAAESMALAEGFGSIAYLEALATGGEVIKEAGFFSKTLLGIPVWGWIAIGSFIAFLFLIKAWTKHETRIVSTECSLWQPPPGGEDCEKCGLNEDGTYTFKKCSEYKCRSLGTLCKFIPENEGTDRPACYNSNPNDVNTPIISPWPENLTGGYTLTTTSNGYKITPAVKAYEKITFGILTNELAQCKISEEIGKPYNEMVNFLGNQNYDLEHSVTLNLEPGQNYKYYIKCQDPSGNANTVDYIIELATQTGPDLTPPLLIRTEPENNAYARYGDRTKAVSLFVNEPSTCKWDTVNIDYNSMQGSFTVCTKSEAEYRCQTDLDVIEGINTFYFRCKDNAGNINSESYELNLIGTQELKITSTSPSGDLYYSEITLEVITEGGAEEGNAVCKFNDVEFINTASSIHTQQLNLTLGSYNYNIFCEDVAGNEATSTINFKVTKDTVPPQILYLYKQAGSLILILDEDSVCQYSNETFNFGTGEEIPGLGTQHSLTIAQNEYHIICQDVSQNEMPEITVYI